MTFEGGFQGRTNKLVDSCYSFWQAGIFPLIDLVLEERNQKQSNSNSQPTTDILYTNSYEQIAEHYVLTSLLQRGLVISTT